jgi:hypothetical protein
MSFADFVEKQAVARMELSLVHTTEYVHLTSIQKSHTLTASVCGVFKEPLLYLFYGRPSYRIPGRTTPTRDVGLYPICFVFKPGTVCKKAKRAYPFDTGASQFGLYEPAIKSTEALTKYPISAVIESARKISKCFFDTDERYLSNDPLGGLVFPLADNEAEAYYRLITGGGDPACDDRCSAVEIQIAEDLDLRSNIMAVALPTCFLDDPALLDAVVNQWHAVPLTYDADKGMRPLEFHGTIRHLVRQYYRLSGVL